MTAPPGRLEVFREVVRSPNLRRLELSFAGFNAAEWSTWIAIIVYAYAVGGPTTVGVLALVMLVPSAIFAPLAAQLGDRLPRRTVMVLGYGLQAGTMGLTGLFLELGLPSVPIFVMATLAAMSVTLTRPAQGALLPQLTRTPGELVAANAVSGTIENLSVLAGPALTGLLLRLGGPGIVWFLMACVMLAATLLVSRISTRARDETIAAGSETGGLISASLAGIAALGRLPGPRLVVSLMFALSVELGALDVLLVVLAFQLLGIGQSGTGFLYAAIGGGGMLGLVVTASLVGRRHLSLPFLAGIAGWGVALAMVGMLPATLAALLFLGLAGAGRNVMDVAGRTLLQRSVPDQVLSRVLGVLEGLYNISMGIGAVLAPLVIFVLGVRGSFIAAGVLLAAIAALAIRPLAHVDRAAVVPGHPLDRARALYLFRPLDSVVLERLAAAFRPLRVSAGSLIIKQGAAGERFYMVDGGQVAVSKEGVEVARLGPGDYFGEIALLRQVPTTATVSALTDVDLLTLEPGIFLEAITGSSRATRHVEAVMEARLRS